MKRIADNKDSLGAMVNGWVITKDLGRIRDKLHEAGGSCGLRLARQSAA